MTVAFKTAALCFVVSAAAGVSGARAQLQPPPFEGPAPARLPQPPVAPAPAPPPQPVAPAPAPPPPQPVAPAPAPSPPPVAPPPARQPQPAPPVARQPQPAPPVARQQAAPRVEPSPTPLADDDAIDDPKVSRRLGTRINVPPPPPIAKERTPAPSPAPVASPAPVPEPRPAAAAPAASPVPAEGEATGVPAIERPYTPGAEPAFQPELPRLKIGLRRFDFIRLGASSTPDGIAASETFNDFSVDVYPVSKVVRIGLTSAFGWQTGTFLDGDYFATQTVSLGAQYKDFGRIVPFAEGFAGVGYMRRVQFDRTIPTAFWQFGVDAGMEVYLARVGYLSFALGYLRPINGFAKRQMFTSVYVDTWSFKVGVGI